MNTRNHTDEKCSKTNRQAGIQDRGTHLACSDCGARVTIVTHVSMLLGAL